jgi:hypothetical protein
MIAFGSAITDSRVYERFAEPGIRLVAEPDSLVLANGSAGSLFRSYNLILDAELIDPDFCQKVRAELSDPEVAIVGCGGAVGVRNIAYWEGSVTWANFTTRFGEMGGGEIQGLSWDPEDRPSYAHTGEVDSIDGFVIVMSPWAVRELRFDESLGSLHGYDLDLCLQARSAGKKVMTADFRAVHHHSLELISDVEGWVAAHMRMADKWDGMLRDDAGVDWEQRARRAEAEAEVARLQLRLAQHFLKVRTAEVNMLRGSKSWKIAAPLRKVGDLYRSLRGRRGAKDR